MMTTLAIQMPGSWHDGGMYGMHWGWWSFWILIALVLGWILSRAAVGRSDRSEAGRASRRGEEAEEDLRRRYARGEIDEEEFARRLEVLRGTNGDA